MVDVLHQALDNSSQLVVECLTLAHAVVCHTSFPFCYDHETPRKICKSTCDIFRPGGVCASTIDQPDFLEVEGVIFSNCDDRITPAGSKPECIHAPFGVEKGRCFCEADPQCFVFMAQVAVACLCVGMLTFLFTSTFQGRDRVASVECFVDHQIHFCAEQINKNLIEAECVV